MKINWKKINIKDLAALVCHKLTENDIDAVLVGGACVSIYTKNEYASFDLDFVSHARLKNIAPVLKELGFYREGTRHFIRESVRTLLSLLHPHWQ